MKRILRLFILSTMAFAVFSCDDYLDINENPNTATASSPEQVLPNALTNTASTVVTYDNYGSWIVGYQVNAGGYGGWGSTVTYNYTTNDYTGLWSSAYDNLNDYNYIEKQTRGNDQLAYYNAIAKIMEAYDFQLLVDAYGNVPYTEALQGSSNVTPAYDNAADIYQSLVTKVDSAVYVINNAENPNTIETGDVMFNGNMKKWQQFANTLKLRLLLRISNVSELSSFVSESFASFDASAGFLTEDAIVNPGYVASTGKQNPFWNMFFTDPSGSVSAFGKEALPSEFVYGFYDGTKIDDPARGSVTYYDFPDTPTNQLGIVTSDVPTAPSGTIAWDDDSTGVGLFKDPTMGQPILLASESYLLQAEAYLKGYLTGDAEAAYRNGIVSSFRYLYKNADNNVEAGYNPAADADAYIASNADNPLVDFSAAASNEQKLEAIITQKYIALNFIFGQEAYNEYRRTGYPKVMSGSTFASTTSAATQPDRLPLRVLYPASEYQVNSGNAPSGISAFNTAIFWDINQ